ncbi:hypothetical protein UFOVP231_46 [uncultured Caudovirales phage]|uniref:Uncharacterized protein n=1 Tax=uncultured Caudovirales phage TaxID=2100421 RepID=A0A6J7WPY5_9CAUD|nr:hypothetical protein UFOVP231_46 [uncultured Caudovirales phage]
MSMRQEGGEVVVTLTLVEMLNGANIGVIRHHESVSNNRASANVWQEDRRSGLSIHVEGAMGEICAAKVRDKYYEGTVNSFKGADIGENIQVRCTNSHNRRLWMFKNDNPDHFYVLVTGVAPTFKVRGWIYGHEGQKEEYLESHNGQREIYYIPTKILRPIGIKPKEKINDFTTQPAATNGDAKG